MESLLEQQRRLHEERERSMESMVKEILQKKSTHNEQINSDHRLKMIRDNYMTVSDKLHDLYTDKDGLRKEEIQALSGPNEFQEFYHRLKQIRDFHKRHPNEVAMPISSEFQKFDIARENPTEDETVYVEFRDEEGYGRYLDLHHCYDKYINLKNIEKIDYLTYLTVFDRLFDIPKDSKNAEYKRYLLSLISYLKEFCNKVMPLADLDEEFEKVDVEFVDQWETGTFPGWPKEQAGALSHAGAHLDLSAFSSPEELASLGLDRLKSALQALGLKCGGTLEERSKRLFHTKGKSLESLEISVFVKAKSHGKGTKKDSAEKQRDIGLLEAKAYRLSELVGEQRVATRENVQRKQARTEAEREDEDEILSEDDSDDDEDTDIPYNPKNLPLGWDGKPIPYWLYKLHGLNITYSCEICGNQTYRGPKAFQRHFAEWRHAHGMRCLGIPNTAHFANVTEIADAKALWAKLQEKNQKQRWQPEEDEEFEDSIGNVLNRKTYEDMKKEGIL